MGKRVDSKKRVSAMIVTRTPLRISLVGGGTDMPSFYTYHSGAVVSAAIDKSIYVFVNPKFDGRYRVSYSVTENVDNISEIQHDIVREVLKVFQVKGLEVVSVSDIPGDGSGLGSSSAFTVGLLRAMYAYTGYRALQTHLAEHAFSVEAVVCGHTVGKQDHYSAACGNLSFYSFSKQGVKIEIPNLSKENLEVINSMLMLFWTGVRSSESETILKDQSERFKNETSSAQAGAILTELASQLCMDLQRGNFERIGKFVHTGWSLKKKLSSLISDQWIDALMEQAMRVGASGAKICGAGGGGFMLVVAHPEIRAAVEQAVGLRSVPFKIGAPGSSVVYSGD